VRRRLIVAFIVIALLAALASSWFRTVIGAYHLPGWLDGVILGPGWLQGLVHTGPGQPAPRPVRHTALVLFGAEAGLLLAIIAAAAIAASRPVLRPVRRLARAAQRMSAGDLPVRIRPRGRDELAQLVTTFNQMASAIPHLFDRFYKADTARARSEGSGLGLAIARENARLHGGHIHAGNHPDGGAIFTVSLPLDAPGSL